MSETPTPSAALKTDIVIVGGGLTGLTLGLILARAGIETVVVDRDPPLFQLDAAFDGRTTAIAAGTRAILDRAGIWQPLAGEGCPIREIRTADQDRPLFLHFDAAEVGDGSFGWIFENRRLREALHQAAADLPGLTHLTSAAVEAFHLGPGHVEVTLSSGAVVRAALAVGADGRLSPTRTFAGIRTLGWRYRQDAIVLVMAHHEPHGHVAVEHFLASGPFATLPMNDDAGGRHRSSIVWTERTERVPHYLGLDQAAFDGELARRCNGHLGAVTAPDRRFHYPLRLALADRIVGDRVALVGDAAHVIHPLAGQNLNLGFRDVAVLADRLVEAVRLGQDPGDARLLAGYERARRLDILTMAAATDGLNRLFSNNRPLTRLVRGLGLAGVGRIGPIKRFFMRHAMGSDAAA